MAGEKPLGAGGCIQSWATGVVVVHSHASAWSIRTAKSADGKVIEEKRSER